MEKEIVPMIFKPVIRLIERRLSIVSNVTTQRLFNLLWPNLRIINVEAVISRLR